MNKTPNPVDYEIGLAVFEEYGYVRHCSHHQTVITVDKPLDSTDTLYLMRRGWTNTDDVTWRYPW